MTKMYYSDFKRQLKEKVYQMLLHCLLIQNVLMLNSPKKQQQWSKAVGDQK